MKAKVRTYKITSSLFDSRRGIFLEREDTSFFRQINIVFDENMYIKYPSNFTKELHELIENNKAEKITENNVNKIEHELNLLLKRSREINLLFLESDFFKHKEGMVVLHKDEYFDFY